MNSDKDNKINDQDVRDALSKIIASADFKKAYRLRQLLVHLVDKQMAGQSEDLKGYNIGLDVFEKGSDFDPDSDTIVRVQMVRLRRMLEHYYLTTGKDDPIIIDVPKGRYVPAFTENKAAPKPMSFEGMLNGATRLFSSLQQRILADHYLSALVIGTIGLMFYLLSSHLLAPPQKTERMAAREQVIVSMPTGPSIAVLPFKNETGKKEHSLLIRGFPAHIIHSLTVFKDLFILAPDTTLALGKSSDEQLDVARRAGAKYSLIGGFGIHKDKISISAFLQRVENKQILWSKDYRRSLTGDNLHEIQTDIAASVAAQLGQPHGVISRLESAMQKKHKKQSYSAYHCILNFHDYAQDETAKKHLSVRKCLNETLKKNMRHAQAWAALSWIVVEEYRRGFNVQPEENGAGSVLDRAFTAARKAVVLDPNDAFVQRRMAAVMTVRGDRFGAQQAIEKALELNPNDADVVAHMGWNLKYSGLWEKAIEYANKAMRLNPGHPPWYLETPILYYYQKNDCKNAYQVAQSYHLLNTETALRELLMIITGMQCEGVDVSKHVKILNTKYPDFLKQPGKLIRNYGIPEDLFSKIIAHLKEAGVAFTS